MKSLQHIMWLVLLSTIAISPLSAQKKGGKKQMDKFTVQVDGLGCPFCAYGLEKKIKKLKGIKKIKINMEDGMLTFDYPSEKELQLKTVEDQVDAAGYTAMSTSVVRSDGSSEQTALQLSDKIEQSRVVKASIPVAGVCGMCRARIKKVTRKIEGIVQSDWDEKTQILTIEYDKGLTSVAAIEAAVAGAGHDTKNVKASDQAYQDLPPCCLYERKHQ